MSEQHISDIKNELLFIQYRIDYLPTYLDCMGNREGFEAYKKWLFATAEAYRAEILLYYGTENNNQKINHHFK